jgi:hypothetical protein
MDKRFRALIQAADKHVRNKQYRCLFPNCQKWAIQSHAIPRASCIEALADSGVLYTHRQSFNETINKPGIFDPPDIVKTGVNQASVFKGYCPEHDSLLFASAETTDRRRKHGMFISLHLRALSLEYSRKRRNADYFRRLAELDELIERNSVWQDHAIQYEFISKVLKETYIGSVFNLMGGSDIDSIEYYCVPFTRNLHVSCCGCFNENSSRPDSIIAYNLISYRDMSILVLTTFGVQKTFIDSFLSQYSLPKYFERLVNDIAFSKCEEPLISANLWRSLSTIDQLDLRLSLRSPEQRRGSSTPTIIKLAPSDLATKVTPEMLTRLSAQITV